MAEHNEIAQGISIDLGAWALKAAVAGLSGFGLKLRKDVNRLQTTEAECRASKEGARPMIEERDRQRLAIWEELKELRKTAEEDREKNAERHLEVMQRIAQRPTCHHEHD